MMPESPPVLHRPTPFKSVVAYLVVSAASVRTIPFLTWGADLHNLHAYQRCAGSHDPYLIPAKICGDAWGRELVYPPLLFRSFFWLRPLQLETAMYVWCSATLAMLAAAHWLWFRIARKEGLACEASEAVLFCALLALQYPLVFLLERGGTDVPPVLLWTMSAWLLSRGQLAWAGGFAGVAAAFKLYPAIPTVIIAIALAIQGWRGSSYRKTDFVRFGLGAGVGFLAPNLFLLRDARTYFMHELPKFASQLTAPGTFMHSLKSMAGADHGLYADGVLLSLFLLYCIAASRSLATRPGFTLAAVLAMSTYFAATSWDYNLVTTYPLLFLLFLEARRTNRWFTLVLGLVAIIGERELFTGSVSPLLNPQLHLALQLAWLVVVALELASPSDSSSELVEADDLAP